jgi:nucleoside 2-deoxyribosyltransferase
MLDEHSFEVEGGKTTRIYLAAPYSHKNKLWMHVRFELVNLAAMALIDLGYVVFSPISHSHPIASTAEEPGETQNYSLWLGQDEHFMEWSDALVVLDLPGWRNSRGVLFELKWFTKRGKPIYFLPLDAVNKHKPRG